MASNIQNKDEKKLIKLQIKVQEAILRRENRKEKLYIYLRKSFLLLLGVGIVYLLWYTIFKEFILTELPMQYLDIHGDWMVATKIFPYTSETLISSLPTPYKIGFYVLPILIFLCVVGFIEIIKDIFRIILLVAKAVKSSSTKLFYIYKLRTDRIFVLDAITKDRCAFINYAHKKFNNDRAIVLAALKQDGSALEYASKSLQNDKEVVLAALEVSDEIGPIISPFEFASESLRKDKEFVNIAVKLQPNALEFVTKELKNDREVVLNAVSANPYVWTMGEAALRFASKNLQNDKEIVLAAVQNPMRSLSFNGNGIPLKYASELIRNDREVVLAAVKNDGVAIEFASKELQNDKEIVTQAVLNNCYAIKYASRSFQVNEIFVQTIVDQIKSQLEFLSNKSDHKYLASPLEAAQNSITYLESKKWLN